MSKFDASIPVLTEVFQDEPAPSASEASAPADAASDTPEASAGPTTPVAFGAGAAAASHPAAWPYRGAAPAASAAPVAPASGPMPAASERAAGTPDDAPSAQPATADAAAPLDWERLERQVSQHVLQQLTARVDFVLEQRIRDSMEEVLTHALRGLTDEIRAGLHEAIGKIVARAVQQEITHLQASAPRQDDKR